MYYILGIVSVIIVYPIIDSIVSLILACIEILKGKASLKVTEINAELREIANQDEEEEVVRKIGFAIPLDEEDADEDL